MNQQNILYVAHPMNVYGTLLQIELLEFLTSQFPGWKLENPDQPHHQEGFASYQKQRNNPMGYFEEEILPNIHGCAGLVFGDGKYPTGVGYEMMRTFAQGHPVWTIRLRGTGTFLVMPEEQFPPNFLSIGETRKRVWSPDGGVRPFE